MGRVTRLFQRLMIPPKLMSKDVLDIIEFKVPNTPGIGVEPNMDFREEVATHKEIIK